MKQKKKKKKDKFYHVLALILVIITVLALSVLIYFNIIPLKYFIPGTILLSVIIFFLVKKLCRRTCLFTKLVSSFFSIVLIIIMIIGINYAFGTISFFNNIFDKGQRTETYELYVLNKSNYSKISELKNQKIALYDNGEEEFASSIKELEKKLTFKEKKYSNIDDAVNSLINEETKGLFLNSSLMDIYLEDHHIENQIRSIESIDLKIKTESELKEVNVTKKPFVVYLSGIDTSGKVNKSARSDVNLAAVVNPKSGKILIISIPRDYYVTLDSKNAKDKLTHAGIYGVLESAKTVGNLLDTEVNYYARVNFTSFIKIIDTIDGISVNVEKPTYRYNGDIDCGANRVCEQNSKREFANKMIYIKPGQNTLNGEEALAYARNRHQYAGEDNARGRHQAQIIEAMINKLSNPRTLTKYNKILSSLKSGVLTNIDQDSITKLINMQLDKNIKWQIETTALTGSNGYDKTYSTGGLKAYVMIPDEESLTETKAKIKEYLAVK